MTSLGSIALTGLKHVGKSTIGHRLSHLLNLEFIDLDDLLVRRAVYENTITPETGGTGGEEPPIRSVYRALGSDTFGKWEAEAIRDIPRAYRGSGTVLATGGGVCDHPRSMELIRAAYCVLYLWNDPVVLYQRAVSHGVPAFLDQERPRDHFLEIAERRDALYRIYADHVVDISGLSIENAAARIIAYYKG